ncbi:hypothetical protein JMJ77_0000112, partial [Colletotrichum scovillei]
MDDGMTGARPCWSFPVLYPAESLSLLPKRNRLNMSRSTFQAPFSNYGLASDSRPMPCFLNREESYAEENR